jgi:hypothetical protein
MRYTEGPDCPLCGASVDDRDSLRVHLMCRHRKSELTDVTLALMGEAPVRA